MRLTSFKFVFVFIKTFNMFIRYDIINNFKVYFEFFYSFIETNTVWLPD